jgi:hypothetical protein
MSDIAPPAGFAYLRHRGRVDHLTGWQIAANGSDLRSSLGFLGIAPRQFLGALMVYEEPHPLARAGFHGEKAIEAKLELHMARNSVTLADHARFQVPNLDFVAMLLPPIHSADLDLTRFGGHPRSGKWA